MDKRERERLNLKGAGQRDSGIGDLVVEIDLNKGPLRGRVVDVSLKGLGIELNELAKDQLEEVKDFNDYFVKIFYGGDSVLAGVKNIWNSIQKEDGAFLFRGGILITIISPEDNLKLQSFVEKFRGSQ